MVDADNPALRSAAINAGMHDADALKMLDLTGVTIAANGHVNIPTGFFAAAKQAKPHLFVKKYAEMSKSEQQNFERSLYRKMTLQSQQTDKKWDEMTVREKEDFERSQGLRTSHSEIAARRRAEQR